MAATIALGFSFFIQGDGTTNPVTFDLRTHPFFTFSVNPLANFNSDTISSEILTNPVASTFDVLKNPPAGFTAGLYAVSSGAVVFSAGTSQYSASLSGYQLTVTPSTGISGIYQVLGVLTFD
jgi:hypothetical protein